MRHRTAAGPGRLTAVGRAVTLAACLQCGLVHALEQRAVLSVQLTLNTASCVSPLFGLLQNISPLSAGCPANTYQISAIRTGTPTSAVWGPFVLDVPQNDAKDGSPQGSTLQQWAMVQISQSESLNRLSQSIAYYELRVDY